MNIMLESYTVQELLDDKLKQIGRESEKEFNNSDWAGLLEKIQQKLGLDSAKKFTAYLHIRNHNPLDAFDSIPVYYKNNSYLSGTITVPDNIQYIGVGAFQGCDDISEVIINADIDMLSNKTFAGCTNLSKVIINSPVKAFGTNVFENTSDNIEVYLRKRGNGFKLKIVTQSELPWYKEHLKAIEGER